MEYPLCVLDTGYRDRKGKNKKKNSELSLLRKQSRENTEKIMAMV